MKNIKELRLNHARNTRLSKRSYSNLFYKQVGLGMKLKLDDHVQLLDHPYTGLGDYGRIVRIKESQSETIYHVESTKDGENAVFGFYEEELKLAIEFKKLKKQLKK